MALNYRIVRNQEEDHADVNVETPRWNLQEVVTSSDIVSHIHEILAFVQNRQKLLNDWGFSRFMKTGTGLSINFFGPPGTGKSITAEAVAAKLGMEIIKVNYADIESKYVGETPKNLTYVFEKADEKMAVLFFDEADSLLSKRIADLSHAADYGVNMARSTLLYLLDKFQGIVIFATNLFENYDDAFLRRITFHIEFPLPDESMRAKLWELHLSDAVPKDITYPELAKLSEKMSGGDIRNLAIKLCLKLLADEAFRIDNGHVSELVRNYLKTKTFGRRPRVVEREVTHNLQNTLST